MVFQANQIVAELIGNYEKIVGPKMFSHIEQEFMERAREFESKLSQFGISHS